MPKTINITFSGLADEAGDRFADQIAAHRALGWREVELRTVQGEALADLDDATFRTMHRQLNDAALNVTTVASRIGSWARPITTPFQQDEDELARLIDRMHALGARYVRVMSYPNDGLAEAEWRDEVLRRMQVLTEIAAQASVVLLHENCSGWAGQSADRTLTLLRSINSPAMKLLFDTGNPVAHGYDGLAFLHRVLPWIEHVHIKDARRTADGEVVFTYPGQGQARLAECMRLLIDNGYRGLWSIEPHLHLIPHLNQAGPSDQRGYDYIEYGRCLEALAAGLLSPNQP